MTTKIRFVQPRKKPASTEGLLVLGRKARLEAADVLRALPGDVAPLWGAMVASLKPADNGTGTSTWLSGPAPRRLAVGALPERCSRHNSPGRPDAITALVSSHAPGKGKLEIVIALDAAGHALAAACAVMRAYPLFSLKSRSKKKAASRTVNVSFLAPDGPVKGLPRLQAIADAAREAGALVDAPTCELGVDAFVAKARAMATELGVGIKVLRGAALASKGFGGLTGVGKAAEQSPALVVLSHRPKSPKKTLAWVGKGIVYDTGGLSLKSSNGMPGMKGDMGGAAAVFMGFVAAVKARSKHQIHAVLCLAENAIGPAATRPDDVLHMYSGKTVEINNTDAEGRLVLADGVAYAAKHLDPDVICDMATLTGAQLVATGRRHAAIVCNDDALEAAAEGAGRICGDLVHPLPYCPEFYRANFKSKIADLKNSVKDRMDAQSSCAGQFVAEHLSGYQGPWLHVDIAGPSGSKERGTGFGVALLNTLFGE